MKCEITFRNMEHTDALDEKIKTKSQKIAKYLGPEATAEWVCWTQKNDQIAELKVNYKKEHYIAKATSEDLYKTMDMVIDKVSSQISKKH
ncbi:MAG: ribosomal subunit interface protein [Halobacteriovorax sp.]|nr:ribosomal subunit interface protein [Halobacteriovorax sp.]MEE3079930.1 ribosome-associated translation inhibitor RaiA [Bdellovibrionota bacterium]|tara:strand:+ start:891 stop:1160 length:270 start_codon:yes stop_codon:yes gene_type:complete